MLAACTALVSGESTNTPLQPLSDDDLAAIVVESAPLSQDPLMDSVWAIELAPQENGFRQPPINDTLIFAEDGLRSTLVETEWYRPATYVPGRGLDRQVVWEGFQRRADGAAIFWRGELQGDQMIGTLSKRRVNGSSQSFTFAGRRTKLSQIAKRPHEPKGTTIAQAARTTPIAPSPLPRAADTHAATLADAHKQIDALTAALADAQAIRRQLEADVARLRDQLNERAAQMESLNATLAQRTRERDDALAARDAASVQGAKERLKTQRLERILKTLATQHDELRIVYERSEADAARWQAGHRQVTEALEEAARDHAKQVHDLERELERMRTKQKDQQRFQEELASAQTALRQGAKTTVAQNAAATEAQRTIHALETALASTREALAQARTLAQTNAAQAQTAQEARRHLQATLEKTRQARETLEAQVAHLRQELEARTHERNAARDTQTQAHARSEQEAALIQQRLRQAEATIQTLTEERDAARRTSQEHAAAHTDLLDAHAQLTQERTRLVTALADHERVLAETKRRAAELEGEIRNLRAERDAVLATQHDAQETHTKANAAWQAQRQQWDQAQAQLQEEHRALAEAFTAEQKRSRQLEAERSQFQSQMTALEAALAARGAEAQSELTTAQKHARGLQVTLAGQEEALKQAQLENDELRQALDRLQVEQDRALARHDSAVASRDQAAQDLAQAHRQLKARDATIHTLSGERDTALRAQAAYAAQHAALLDTQSQLQQQLTRLAATLADHERAWAEHRDEMAQRLHELHATLAAVERQRDDLTTTLTEREADASQLQELARVTQDQRRLQGELTQVRAGLEEQPGLRQTLEQLQAILQEQATMLTRQDGALAELRQQSDVRSSQHPQEQVTRDGAPHAEAGDDQANEAQTLRARQRDRAMVMELELCRLLKMSTTR